MTPERHNRISELFLAVCDLDAAARIEALQAACGDDPALRGEVEALLAQDSGSAALIGTGAAVMGGELGPAVRAAGGKPSSGAATVGWAKPREWPRPKRIDRYTILDVLGEGGMGIVYLAEQDVPRRRVALKVILPGKDTRAVIARFEAERQALGLMDHPNVARVYDAGMTEQARPYFVMEYVAGRPITDYCDEHRLTIDQRLDLFMQVCDAVQHAHQKGIIHRDLKPSNILVSDATFSRDPIGERAGASDTPPVHDRAPDRDKSAICNLKSAIPKVIDFGIAKAIGDELADTTRLTQFGDLVGTPAYMSPEQAALSPDIDTRSDVYALGVLLYELLTGTLPFDPEMLRAVGLDEARRMIREVEPPKPSTRLAVRSPAVATGKDRRDGQPAETATRVPGDAPVPALELPVRTSERTTQVVRRALEPTDEFMQRGGHVVRVPPALVARNRATDVGTLARLVRGDLDWIVLKALEKDRSRRYATAADLAADVRRHVTNVPVAACPPSTFYRVRKFARRNRALVSGVAATVLVLVGGVATTSVQTYRARQAEKRAVKLAESESQQRHLAEQAAREARRISQSFRELLASPAPERDGRSVTVAEQLDRAARKFDTEFADFPTTAAELHAAIGETYASLGLYSGALAELERAVELYTINLGQEDERTLTAQMLLLEVVDELDESSEHLGVIRATLDSSRRVLGDEHATTLRLLATECSSAFSVESFRQYVSIVDRVGPAVLTERNRILYPLIRFGVGVTDRVMSLWEQILSGELPSPVQLEAIVSELSGLARDLDTLIERTWTEAQSVLRGGHPSLTLVAILESGRRWLKRDDAGAVSLLRTARDNSEALLGQDSYYTAMVTLALGAACYLTGDQIEGDRLVAALQERAAAGSDVRVLSALFATPDDIASLKANAPVIRRLRDAIPSLSDWLLAKSLEARADSLYEEDDYDEAEPLYRNALDIARKLFGHGDPFVATCINNLALILIAKGDYASAEPLFREALAIWQDLHEYAGDDQDVATGLNNVGYCLESLGRSPEALPYFEAALAMEERLYGGDHLEVAKTLRRTARRLDSLQRLAEALPKYEAALAMRQRLYEGDNAHVAVSLWELAVCQQRLGRATEALPNFEAALAMEQRLYVGDHAEIATSLESVAECRQLLGRPNEALPAFEAALAMRQRLGNGDDLLIADTTDRVGDCLASLARWDEAQVKFGEALELRRKLLGDDDPLVIPSLNGLALVLRIKGDYAAAEPLLREALRIARARHSDDDQNTAGLLCHLGKVLHMLAAHEEAEQLVLEAVQMYRSHSEWLPGSYPNALSILSTIYRETGRVREAAEVWHEYLDVQRRSLSSNSPELASALAATGVALLHIDEFDAAEDVLGECLEIRTRLFSEGHEQAWSRFNAMSLLGRARAGQHRFAEAEPLLLDGYAGLTTQTEFIPAIVRAERLRNAHEALVELFEAWHATEPDNGYDAKAAEWRAKLAEWHASTQPSETAQTATADSQPASVP